MSEESELTFEGHQLGGISCGLSEDAPLPPLRTYGRCRGCKHWDTEGFGYNDQPTYDVETDEDVYGEKRLPGDWGTCERIMHRKSRYIGSEQPGVDDWAYLSDGSGYFASLATLGGFGCILFDPKDIGEE